MQVSYRDLFPDKVEDAHAQDVRVGDLVRTGGNFHPHFRVIAVHADKAWVRNVETGQDGLVHLGRCRLIEGGRASA